MVQVRHGLISAAGAALIVMWCSGHGLCWDDRSRSGRAVHGALVQISFTGMTS
jgi:hypothetical protein